MASLFSLHVDRWKDCTACDLSETRDHVVLARGSLPCSVLFIGEAPGESENVIGRPFVGPAGRLLDSVIERSVPEEMTYALTNLVACIPRESTGKKASEPLDHQVEACKPRLVEFVTLANPRLIICVGNLARDWLDGDFKRHVRFHKDIKRIHVTHPAAIIRAAIAQRELAIRRCIVVIQTAIEELTCRA